ncbi:hypothetical protein D3C71_1944020 [compost metagenome]
MEAVLRADGADMAARMQAQGLTRATDRGEAFIDEGGAMMAVEVFGIVRADEVHRLGEP